MSKHVAFDEHDIKLILSGHKTQFRKVVYGSGWNPNNGVLDSVAANFKKSIGIQAFFAMSDGLNIGTKFPYGLVGDVLWVQEKHARLEKENRFTKPHYFADGGLSLRDRHDAGLLRSYPAYLMPKWASRINIQITKVRVEKLQQISLNDLRQEGGVAVINNRIGANFGKPIEENLINDFAKSWNESTNAKFGDTWETNPYVWVVDFEVIKK